MTFKEILNQAVVLLEERNIDEAQISAWQLMEFVWNINRSYYFTHSDDIIEAEKATQYMSLIKRRGEHIPLQYLTNKAYFMGHTFYVNRNVLIPRLDTEILVSEVLGLLKPRGEESHVDLNDKEATLNILDMCTGSGCVIISLLLGMKTDIKGKDGSTINMSSDGADNSIGKVRGTGVDISREALEVAKKNAKDLGAMVDFVESNLFSCVSGKYDVIVSNPPYIKSAVLAELMPEVKEHEPLLALDGKEDGLYYYRQIVAQAKDFLKKQGWLAFEIGYDEGIEVVEMMTVAGYQDIQIIKDLAGLDRVVIGQRG